MIRNFFILLFLTWAPLTVAQESTTNTATTTEAGLIADKGGLTDAIVAKLSADQLQSILIKQAANQNNGWASPEVIAPPSFFLAVIIAMMFPYLYMVRRQREAHTTLRLMVEKGAEIPRDLTALLQGPSKSPLADFRKGALLIGLGIGISLVVGFVNSFEDGSWASGLIPTFLGLGFLTAFFMNPDRKKSPSPSEAGA